jgi:DNA-binding CsgD family transcriptional regulator
VDCLWLTSGACRGTGISLCGLYDQVQRPNVRQARLFRDLAEHMSTGFRARAALKAVARLGNETTSTFAPKGPPFQLDAKAGGKRSAVAEQLVAAVQARNQPDSKRSAHASEVLFQAFVGGDYVLIDSLESDGKRWIIARRGHSDRAARLSSRESTVAFAAARGDGNRSIGRDLGLAERTVAGVLRGALTKLGMPDRKALAQWFGASRAIEPGP